MEKEEEKEKELVRRGKEGGRRKSRKGGGRGRSKEYLGVHGKDRHQKT